MSYLVDALRKAEHERRQGAAPGVAALSARLPRAQPAGRGVVGWLVAVLVVCNLALFGYLLWPQADSEIDAQTGPQAGLQPPQVAQRTVSTPLVPIPGKPDTTRRTPVAKTTTVMPGAATAATAAAHNMAGTGVRNQGTAVTRAANGGVARVSSSPHDNIPQPWQVPDVNIHGHLFSNNPAESFILVGGHIYHEGERLPSGVTVVRIDRSGALLNYRGRRFHVEGPA